VSEELNVYNSKVAEEYVLCIQKLNDTWTLCQW